MKTFKAEAITAMVRRGLYGKGMRRTPLMKAITGLLAFQMLVFGVAPTALASDLGDIFNTYAVDGKLPGGTTYNGGGATFMDGSENGGSGVEISGTGTTVFHTSGHWDVTGGSLSSAGWVYLLAAGGITFSGGTFNVDGLVAAAMNGFSFGNSYSPGDVTGSIEGSARGSGSRVYIGQSVSDSSGTIVATDGMSPDSSFSIASGGGKITFKGEMGANSTLKAGTVEFQDVDTETKSSADGNVDTGDTGTVSGDFTQKGGSVTANEISGTLTQEGGQATATTISTLNQKGGRADATTISSLTQNSGNGQATATTIGSLNQTASGATATAGEVTGNATVAGALNGKDGSLSIGSLTQQGSSTITANNALTIKGSATQSAGSIINATGGVTLDAGTAEVSLNQAGNNLGTVSGNAGAVTLNNSGNLTLGTLSASSLNATAGGHIWQSGATTLTGTGAKNVTLDAGANRIDISHGVSGAGTLTLTSSSTADGAVKVSGGTVTAQSINMGGSTKTLSQTGGEITVSGANFLTSGDTLAQSGGTANFASSAATVKQDAGVINATTLSGATVYNRGEITATTISGELQQNGGVATADTVGKLNQMGSGSKATVGEITGDAMVVGTLDAKSGTLSVGGGLTQGSGTINATTLTTTDGLTQNAGTINVTTLAGGLIQNKGTINASVVNGTVTQEADGTIRNQAGDLTFNTSFGSDKQKGTLSSSDTITLAGGDTLSGKVTANILTAGSGDITQTAGTITLGESLTAGTFTQSGAAATRASAANIAANVNQTGDGTIVGMGSVGGDGKTVSQSGAGAIKTDHVFGAVSQTGTGAATLQANTANGTLVLDGDVVQNNANATIGTASTGVTVNQDFTQTAGKVEANTLTLGKETAYDLTGGRNAVSTLSSAEGKTQTSVRIDNGTTDISLTGLATTGDHGVTVTSAKDVTLDGVTAAKITVNESSGQVKDTTAQTADMTITLGDAANNKTVGSVLLTQGSGAVTIDGINAAGDVAIQNDAIVQNGAISGANVTLDQTDEAGMLTVEHNITATGDILVRSAEGVSIGDSDYSPTLSANGNIVVKGKSAEIKGKAADDRTLLKAKAIGVEATDGDVTIENANFVASDGVALKASGDLNFDNNVAMGKTTAGQKDASLVVYADGTIDDDVLGANRPADNLTIAKGAIGLSSDSAAPTEIELNRFAYKTDSENDIFVKFSGAEIGLESKGNVSVDSTRADGVTIVAGSSSLGGNGTKVEAKDATVTSGTVKEKVEIGDSSGDDNLAGGLIASGEGKTVTLDPVGSVTVANGAKISSNADLNLATAAGKTFNIIEGGMVESTAGDVSITSGGQLTVSGTVQANATGKNVKLETTGNSTVAVYGTAKAANTLDINSGATSSYGINEGSGASMEAKSIVLHDQTLLGGNVTAEKIDATGNTLVIGADAGTIKATGTDGIVADSIIQNGGDVKASKLDAAVTQNASSASMSGATENGNVEITKAFTQNSGIVDVGIGTLTLRDDSTSAGTINADKIVVQAADNTLKNLEQDGAGTITVTGADGIKASEVVQSWTGTIVADKIDAALTQSGAATAKANADDGTITVVGALTQSAQNATVGAAGQNVTLQGGATQQGHGKVLADTLAVTGAEIYTLSSTEGNNVATLTSKMPEADVPNPIASVTINNGNNALTVKDIAIAADLTVDKSGNLKLGSNADVAGTATITDAGTVSFEGLAANTVNVVKSGAVTDTGDGLAAQTVNGTPTITLGTGGDNKVASVLLDNSAKLNLAGVQSVGDVGVKAEAITQSGAISGANVTLDQTAGTLTVGKNVTATAGDILVRSADAVKVGDAGTAPTLSADGNIVVKGKNAVTIDNANLTAKEIGVEATKEKTETEPGGTITLKDAKFVVTGTGEGMDGVALKSGGNMTIDTGVEAGKAAAANKDAKVTISAGNELFMPLANQPTAGDNLAVAAKKLTGIDITAGDTVEYKSFFYTHFDETKPDLNFKFTGETLSLQNTLGGVKVETEGQNVSIVKTTSTGISDVVVEARDVVAAEDNATDKVEIPAEPPAGSEGIKAKNDIDVDGTAGNGKITVAGKVSSTEGTVKLQSGGELEVAAGGTVETLTADKGITLTSGNDKDITVARATTVGGTTVAAGEVVSKGDLTLTSAKDIALKGTVKTDGNLVMTAAKDINQTDGSVTANGEGKTTQLTATDGSITLNATTTDEQNNVVPANDFTTITKAVAKNGISISDRNALEIAGDGVTTTDASGDIDIKAMEGLTIAKAVTAGGNATLTAGTIDASATITAADDKAVTATADTDATFGAKVQGGSVALTANEGTLTTDEIETKAGAATLTAGTAASGNNATKAGTIQANNTITANGGDVVATAQGNVTVTKAVDASNAGAVTITAENGGIIDASAADATITADDNKKVTATADKDATFGAKVQGGSVALTAKEGTLTTAEIESKAGKVTLTAGTATPAKAGTIQANDTITANGGGVEATAQGNATFNEAVKGTGVALTANEGTLTTKGAVEATTGNARLTATVDNADSDNTGEIDAQATVTAARAVTATADKDATFGAKVQGGSVALTAKEGTLTTAEIESTAGKVTLTAGTATPAKAGTIQANDTITANGGGVEATAQGDATFEKAVTGKGVALTANKGTLTVHDTVEATDGNARLTATVDNARPNTTGKIAAGATITAARAVTATADKDATFGAKVQGGSVALTVKEGALTTSEIESTAGKVTLTAGTATPAKAGTIQANDTITANGGGVEATAQGDATFEKAVTGKGVALTANNEANTGKLTTKMTVEAKDGNARLSAGTIAAAGEINAKNGKISARSYGEDGATFEKTVEGKEVELTANESGALTTKGAVTATETNAKLTGASVDAQGTVTAKNGLVSMTATSDTTGEVKTKAVSGKNVSIEAKTGVTEGDVVSADEDKFVHTTKGNITISKDFTAKNAVYKADNGNIVISEQISGVTDGLGLEGDGLTVDGTKISGVKTLVVNSKTGDVTITGKPDGVETFAVAADGNLTVQNADGSAVEGDFTFANGSVTVGVPANKAANDRTVAVDGLQAGNNLTVNVSGAFRSTSATATSGNIAIDAATANVGNATAGGTASVNTTGDATIGSIEGTTVTIDSQNGTVSLTGTANARTGDASVTAANGEITGNGNVTAAGAATVSTAENGGQVVIGNVTAGGEATVNGSAVTAGNITGNGTTVTARNGGITAGDIGRDGATAVTAGDAVEAGLITGDDVNVNAGGAVTANQITGGNVVIEAGGVVTANGGITGTGGTTITSTGIEAGGADVGQGGATTITANGGAINAGRLVSGGPLQVIQAGTITADIDAGGNANIQAASLTAGSTTSGDLTLNIGGDADLGEVDIGDLNGEVNGQLTIANGTADSIGQNGGFTTGEFQLDGTLNSGAVEMDAGTLQMDGDLNANNSTVDITARGGIQGGGTLTAGALTLQGGNIGAPGNAFTVNSATLLDIRGGQIYLTDTSAGPVALNIIDGTGNVDLQFAGPVIGGGTVTAGQDLTIRTRYRFGDLLKYPQNGGPITVVYRGELHVYGPEGASAIPLLHIVVGGDFDPSTFNYHIEDNGGFAVRYNNGAYQIVDPMPDKMRLINRALAFTVNTPELKSKQGVFGDPNMIHTKMSVSEARSLANMDMLSLSAVNFRKTWEGIRSKEGASALNKWWPKVYPTRTPLWQKLEAVASELETQPEIRVQEPKSPAGGQQ